MINLCRIFGQKDVLFINHSVATYLIGLILSCSLHLKLQLYDCTDDIYTAEYLLVLACILQV